MVAGSGANAQVVLNQLYKMTQLQETFGVINLALVDDVHQACARLDVGFESGRLEADYGHGLAEPGVEDARRQLRRA